MTVSFDPGFKEPEMVKTRLCIVISPKIQARPGLCTVVPLSTTPPLSVQPYHCELDIPFTIPEPWGNKRRWVKGDMICAVGFHRVNLIRLGKDETGKRIYQTTVLPTKQMESISNCVLYGLGLPSLTEQKNKTMLKE